MTVSPLDLSTPSYRAAYQLARPLAVAGDRKGAAALFTRLLFHVPVEDGGLMGMSEDALETRCASDPRLDHVTALEAVWNPGPWPTEARRAA